jgi:hypothetical protein
MPANDASPVVSETASTPAGDSPGSLADASVSPGESLGPAQEDSITARRGTSDATGTGPKNVAARLAVPVRSLQLRAVPLSQFVDQLGDMAATPITIDPLALELTGISPRQEIALEVQDTTVDRILRETLKRHRMDFVERDGQIRIIRAAVSLPNKHDVSDLAANESEAQILARMIERFVEPESWSSVGGAGELTVKGTSFEINNQEKAVIGLILFCERLRIARGLPMKSRYPAERLSIESPYSRIAAKLERPTTFTFVPWTRLSDVLRDWQSSSGITMLVDWPELAEVELGPSSPISCSVINRTWGEALDGVLAQLGLGWWAMDGETIQITCREKVTSARRLEFHSVPQSFRNQFASESNLIESLKDHLRKSATREDSSILGTELAFDPVSGRLMALGNAAAHRSFTQLFAGE